MVQQKQLFIDGPVNTLRLEGEINGIKKVLWIMGDYHLEVEKQYKCEDIRSQNIVKFLVQNFDKMSEGDKTYDFFLEIYPTTFLIEKVVWHNKYIWELQELTKKSINIQEGKMLPSKEFQKTRFHYMDIRDYIYEDSFNIFMKLQGLSQQILNSDIYPDDLRIIADSLKMIATNTKAIMDLLIKNTPSNHSHKAIIPKTVQELQQQTPADIFNITKQLVEKMISRYKHDQLKKFANEMIKKDIVTTYELFFKRLNEFLKELEQIDKQLNFGFRELNVPTEKTRNNLMNLNYNFWNPKFKESMDQIQKGLNDLDTSLMHLFALIVDLFFLRRFLDKDYITNAGVYTGMIHSANYVYYLVKYFDFKITHASYLKGSPKEVEKIIKNAKFPEVVYEYIFPKIFNQCSDLTGFPEMFE